MWYQKLQSLVVLKPNLDNWYDGKVDLQDVDLDFCRRKARSIHAFRGASESSLPDSSFKISAQSVLSEQLLRGDHLIWLADNRRQVHILNLRTMSSKTIVPTARELIRSIDASDDLVLMTTDAGGAIYVGEMTGHSQVKRFRLSSSRRDSVIACRRRTVACATPGPDGVLIYIWNYDLQAGRSFTITRKTPILAGDQTSFPDAVHGKGLLNGIGLLVQPDTETLVLCLLPKFQGEVVPHACTLQLLYYRFTFSGDCLHGAEKIIKACWGDVVLNSWTALRFTAASHNGAFMLHCNTWDFGDTFKTICTLHFDENLHTLTDTRHARLRSANKQEQASVVWWKDTTFEAGTDYIIVCGETDSNPCNESVLANRCVETRQRTREDQQTVSKQLLVNHNYIVRLYCDAIHVYCYDHTVHLPGKEGIVYGVGPWRMIDSKFAIVNERKTAVDDM